MIPERQTCGHIMTYIWIQGNLFKAIPRISMGYFKIYASLKTNYLSKKKKTLACSIRVALETFCVHAKGTELLFGGFEKYKEASCIKFSDIYDFSANLCLLLICLAYFGDAISIIHYWLCSWRTWALRPICMTHVWSKVANNVGTNSIDPFS